MLEFCEVCDEETEHLVLKARGRYILLKCIVCNNVKGVMMEKTIKIRCVVSRDNISEKKIIIFPKNQMLKKGDMLYIDSNPYKIAAIETIHGMRDNVLTQNVKTLFLKDISRIKIRVSVVMERGITKSFQIDVSPDKIFRIGEIISYNGKSFWIYAMSCVYGTRRKGSEIAYNIKTIYAK